MTTVIAVVVGCLFIGGFVWFSSNPKARMRLNQALGKVSHQVLSVHRSAGGIVIAERVALRRSFVGRVSYLLDDGTVRSRYFNSPRTVLGITGDLAWTDAAGRPSLTLPALEDGPLQAAVVEACGLRSVEVVVDDDSGKLRVTTEDGRVMMCDPGRGTAQEDEGAAAPRADSTSTELQLSRSERVSTVVHEGRDLSGRLLDAELAVEETRSSRRTLLVDGEILVAFRRSLVAGVSLHLGRYAPTGERWTTELAHEACTLVQVTTFIDRTTQVVAIGRDSADFTCAVAVDLESGAIRWGSRLGA